MSSRIAVVGAWLDDELGRDAGAAYVFARSFDDTIDWRAAGKLMGSDTRSDDRFGVSLAVSGTRIVVGAYLADTPLLADSGAAYVFEPDPRTETWTQTAKLTARTAAAGDQFGVNVGVDGDIVVVGSHKHNAPALGSGTAYIFQRNPAGGNDWSRVTDLASLVPGLLSAGDEFGIAVAVSGRTVAVGAWGDDQMAVDAGAVHLFELVGENWVYRQKLAGTSELSWFGRSVALSGDTLAVGARRLAAGGDAGTVALFHHDSARGNWALINTLAAGGEFGVSLGLDANTLVAGAFGEDEERGLVHVFRRADPSIWTELLPPLQASDRSPADRFGYAVAVNGNAIAVGAYLDDNSGRNTGSAYLFTPPSIDTPPVANSDEFSGLEDALLSGTVLANDFDPDEDPLSAILGHAPNAGQSFSFNPDGQFNYQPSTNYFGSDFFTYYLTDGQRTSSTATVSLVISPVNDAPSFVVGSNITVQANSGPQRFTNWARNISAGPEESNQSLRFVTTASDTNLFVVLPAISPSGDLTFTSTNRAGTAVVGVRLLDDGGTSNGGRDLSDLQSFNITITSVPVIRVAPSRTNIVLSWAAGGSFVLQANDRLFPERWIDLPTENTNVVRQPVVGPSRFFRLRPSGNSL